MKKQKYNQKGFTLYEMLVYLAIFGVVISSFVSLSLLINGIRSKNYLLNTTNYNLQFIDNFIGREIRIADLVLIPAPGETSDTLLISQTDGNMSIEIDAGVLYAHQGTKVLRLSTNQMQLSNLSFVNLGTSDSESSIKYSYEMKTHTDLGKYNISTNIQGAFNTK